MTDSGMLDHEPTAVSRRKKRLAGPWVGCWWAGLPAEHSPPPVPRRRPGTRPRRQLPRLLPRQVRRSGQILPLPCAFVRGRKPAPNWRPLRLWLSRRSPVASSTGPRPRRTAQRPGRR